MAVEVKALKSRFKDRADILDLTSFYACDDVFKADYLIQEEAGKKLEKSDKKSKSEKEEKSQEATEASESSRVEGEDGEKTETHRLVLIFPLFRFQNIQRWQNKRNLEVGNIKSSFFLNNLLN